ncbi:MAG: aspartate aminotransferase family protein [Hyphomicrobiaceae bacterium]
MSPQDSKPNSLNAYWMPFTPNRAFKKRPRILAAADGLHFISDDNRKIFDATSGLFCVNAGHGRRPIVEAIKQAAETLDYAPPFQYSQPEAFELAERLAMLAPGDLDHVLLANSGSEAVDTALKVALSYHRTRGEGQRTRFIGRGRGYHGVGFGGISVGGMVANRKAYGNMLSGVDHLSATYNREKQAFSIAEPDWGGHLAEELNELVTLHGGDTIAAVIVEPTAGSTGCLPPPKGYLERLRAITKQHGILLIFDEVITGFGRLGHAFAADRYGIVPDMITFAKGVTNGAVPMSGVMVRKGIHDAHMQGPEHLPELFHGYTYSGHPLATAAALATLELYHQEDLFKRASSKEPLFGDAMMTLREEPHVVDIRPIGMMCGIDLEPQSDGIGKRGYRAIEESFHNQDLYVRVTADTLIIAPPLIAEETDIGEIRDRVGRVLRAVEGDK